MAEGYGFQVGDTVLIAAVVVVGALLVKPILDATSGVGNAGSAVGSTAGGFLDFGGDVADGVGESTNFVGGGIADVVRVPGRVARDVYGGSVDVVDGAGDYAGGLLP